MTEIPDDVMKAATQTVAEIMKDPRMAIAPFIARAILAERERCAKVALSVQDRSDYYNGAYDGVQDVIDGINNS